MALPWFTEIMEQCRVSPPPNSVPTTSIPITFLDIPWLMCAPIQRLLFYEYPHLTTLHFQETILSKLKHSLSLTLQHFFPLAGTLVCPSTSQQSLQLPHILYENGDSYIPLIIAQSNQDFALLIKNHPRDAREFHRLVPQLLSPSDTDQAPVQLVHPLIALQVTIFPNSGISIGYTYRHIVGDGRAITNFIKSWASIFKSNGELSRLEKSSTLLLEQLPILDRAATIKNPNGLLTILWNQWCDLGSLLCIATTADASHNKLRATFVLGCREIDILKHWITSQLIKNMNVPPLVVHVSTFVTTCAFIWICLVKTEKIVAPPPASDDRTVSSDDDFLYHFGFLADITGRTEFRVPKTYFGNCLAPCGVSIRRSEALGEYGLLIAAKAIMKGVKEFDSELLRKAKSWIPEFVEIVRCGHLVSVAGSPKLRVYDTDFGWGRPRKSEVVHIDMTGSISLTECREEEGGVEVGLALNMVAMDAFISVFELGLKDFI